MRQIINMIIKGIEHSSALMSSEQSLASIQVLESDGLQLRVNFDVVSQRLWSHLL
jgi:hypothetical protein